MIATIAAALIIATSLAGQRPAGRHAHAASRFLPSGTLVCVELAPAAVWQQHATHVDQLALLGNDQSKGLLRWLLDTERRSKLALAGLEPSADLLATFDRGSTLAWVFDRKQDYPELYLLGAATERPRDLDRRLDALCRPTKARETFESKLLPIADSPATAHTRVLGEPQRADGWARFRGFVAATKGRLTAFHVRYRWERIESEERDLEAEAVAGVARLLGLAGRDRAGSRLAARRIVLNGTRLARVVLRWRDAAMTFGKDREKKEFERVGLTDFTGLESVLTVDGDATRELTEVHWTKTDKPSLSDMFKANERGLGNVAAVLPATTLGVIRIAVDGKAVGDWTYRVSSRGGRPDPDLVEFYRFVRPLLGLPSSGTNKAIEEIDAVTVAILPPAPGSLIPEPVVLVRVPPNEGQIDRALGVLRAVHAWAGNKPFEIKTLGNGSEAVHYLSLKQVFTNARAADAAILSGLFGGGFISVTRCGPWLAIGCNPRTVRTLHRATASGKTLAGGDEFARRFPPDSGRVAEAWLDWPEIASKLTLLNILRPILTASFRSKAPPFPKLTAIAAALQEQWLTVEHEDYGFAIKSKGSTLTSPALWAITALALTGLDRIGSVLR